MVKMSDEMIDIVKSQPFVVISTITAEGVPHLIVASEKKVIDEGEKLALGRWQMSKTEENLENNSTVIVMAIDPKKRRSVRFFGEGKFEKKENLDLPEGKAKEYLVVDIKRIQYGQWGKDTNVDFAVDLRWQGRFGFKRTKITE